MNRRGLFCVILILSLFCLSLAPAQVGRGKFGIGLSATGNLMQSDWPTSYPGYGALVDLSYSFGNNWGLRSTIGLNDFTGKALGSQNVISTVFMNDYVVTYEFLRNRRLNPFVYAGAGVVFFYPRIQNSTAVLLGKGSPWDVLVTGGVGLDYFIDESWSVIFSVQAVSLGADRIDGMVGGKGKDQFQRVSLGVRYYLFDRSAVQKIVDAVAR